MEAFETTLTGSDGTIDGLVTEVNLNHNYPEAIQFISLDDSLHLVIAKNIHGGWMRVSGTEPYFAAWVDELAEKVAKNKN